MIDWQTDSWQTDTHLQMEILDWLTRDLYTIDRILISSCPCVCVCWHRWSVGDWGVCSRTCGSGEQSRQVQCVQMASHTRVKVLSDEQCVQPPPVRTHTCNTHSCPPTWSVGTWTQVRTHTHTLVLHSAYTYITLGYIWAERRTHWSVV